MPPLPPTPPPPPPPPVATALQPQNKRGNFFFLQKYINKWFLVFCNYEDTPVNQPNKD